MISFLLGLLLSFCIVACRGDRITINSKSDFNNFVQLSHKPPFNHDVELNIDLDFSSDVFRPLGTTDAGQCIPFSGTFDGRGHSIKNLFVGTELASFFCHLNDAVVKNVVFESSCLFRGRGASSLSYRASGKVIIQNVINRAPVTGHYYGAAGLVYRGLPGSRIYFLNCINEADVSARDLDACGITCASESSSKVFVLNSVNKGNIYGMYAYGICCQVFFADNVVNAGLVTGNLKYSFWTWQGSPYTFYLYGISDGCAQCDADKVSLFKRKSNGSYRLKNKNILLADVLNRNAKNMQYGFLWTRELNLEEYQSSSD